MKKILSKEKIDISRLNEVIRLSNSILKMGFVFFAIIGVYAITLILKEWKIFEFVWVLLTILSPLFIGIIIAWLLEPFVKALYKKGVNRMLGTSIVYAIMLLILYLAATSLFPLLLKQVNDFLSILPSILDSMVNWANKSLVFFNGVSIIDVENIKADFINYINNFVSSLTTDIPTMIINLVRSVFSTLGVFVLGLFIGFYLLLDFENVGKTSLLFLPKRIRLDVRGLLIEANSSLFAYIKGTVFVSILIFALSTIALSLIGVEAPLLLGLICGVTNIIPYIGPYLGGFPAVVVAFTQSIPMGILTVITLFVIQTIEGNFIAPLVMSKTMKLHPVSIIIGILVFGYFFGIVGMIISTPLVAIIKSIFMYIEKKYNVLKFVKEQRE